MKIFEGSLSAKDKKIFVVISRFNEFISSKLLEGCRDALKRHGMNDNDLGVAWVPGAFEIPMVAKKAASSGKYDAVICLGAVIRGDTPHFEFVASESAKGVALAGIETGVPVIYGILTTDNLEQAIERAGTKAGNKGFEAAQAAMEMIDLYRQLD